MKNKRITESELVLPSLYLMYINGGTITTTELIGLLTQLMKPVGIDAEILTNRKDTYFSQKVRNLKSHDTLIKMGVATYEQNKYKITNIGIKYVMQNKENIQYLFSMGFDYNDIKDNLGKLYLNHNSKIIPYSELITEGEAIIKTSKITERSQKLRNIAIEHFSCNGIIKCDCCGFEFKTYYGDTYGKTCIEIHHLKPIFQYEGKSETKTIEDALNNLLPVCPNCHRVIHKNNITLSMLPDFKLSIANQRH